MEFYSIIHWWFKNVKSSLKTKIWLYVSIISRTRFRVNLHSAVAWISRNSSLETGEKFKWQQRNSKYIINNCYTINMKKYLHPRQGSYFGPLNFIFSALSQKIWYSCHEQKKIILLKHLLGLAFLMFMKYCFLNFV